MNKNLKKFHKKIQNKYCIYDGNIEQTLTVCYGTITAPKLLLAELRKYRIKIEIQKGKETDLLFIKINGKSNLLRVAFVSYEKKLLENLSFSDEKLLKTIRGYNKTSEGFNKYNFTYTPDIGEYGSYESSNWQKTMLEDFLEPKKSSDMERMPKRLKYEPNWQEKDWEVFFLEKALYSVLNGFKVSPWFAKRLRMDKQEFIQKIAYYGLRNPKISKEEREYLKLILSECFNIKLKHSEKVKYKFEL